MNRPSKAAQTVKQLREQLSDVVAELTLLREQRDEAIEAVSLSRAEDLQRQLDEATAAKERAEQDATRALRQLAGVRRGLRDLLSTVSRALSEHPAGTCASCQHQGQHLRRCMYCSRRIGQHPRATGDHYEPREVTP